MSRNRIPLLLLLLAFCSAAFAQNIKFGVQLGIGTYSMTKLKELNTSVLESLPFEAKIVSNYPPYFYYKPAFLFSFYRMNIGLKATYYSTGSRISSKDYSGEYLFDSKVSCLAPGVYADFYLFRIFKDCRVAVFSEGGIIYSKIEFKESLIVDNEEIINKSFDDNFKEYYVEPGLKFEFRVHPAIMLELNTSYFVQFTGEGLVSKGPDWRGLRLGLSVLATTPFKKHDK